MNRFTEELLVRLDGRVSDDDLRLVAQELDMLLVKYEVAERKTEIVPFVDVPECYKAFLLTKKIEGKSDKSLKCYKYHLDYFFEHMMKPLEEITMNDMVLYLYQAQHNGRTGKPLSATSTENIRLTLSSFFSWAFQNGYIPKNPMVNIHRIKGERKQRQPINDAEIETIRDAMDYRKKKKGCQKYVQIRNRALFEFILSTGARVSEVARLNKSDINLETKAVKLFGKGKKHRVSYMNAKAIYHLNVYLEERDDDNEALFVRQHKPHERMTADGIQRALHVYSKYIDGSLYPHRLRHTMATNAVNHGMPLVELQALLGHEKADTTLIYAHICDEQIKESHRKYVV